MSHKTFWGTILLATTSLTAGTFTAWSGSGNNPSSTLDFESIAAGGATFYLSSGIYGFAAPNAEVINVNAPSIVGSGNYLLSYGSPLIISVSDPTVYALGFNLGCVFCTPGSLATQITATDSQGTVYTVNNFATASASPAAFFGVSSTANLTQIQINFGQSYFGIDNIVAGDQSANGGGAPPPSDTPEAATIILIGTGLVTMARYHRHVRIVPS